MLPMTSYSQNIAIVAIAGARSRYVCVAAGVLLMLLGTIPKLAFLVTCIPNAVLGGAALVMFGMVAASGIAIISEVDLRTNRKNLYVIAVGLSMGLIPAFDPAFFAKMPTWTEQFLHSGILVGTVTLVVLNLLLNGLKSPRDEQELIESALIEGETIA
jgi:xanthine/uracil permease